MIITDSVWKKLNFPAPYWKVKLSKDRQTEVISLTTKEYEDTVDISLGIPQVYITHLAITGFSLSDNISHILIQMENNLRQRFGSMAAFTHVAVFCGINSFITSYKAGLDLSPPARKLRQSNFYNDFKRLIMQLSWSLPQAKLLYMGGSSMPVKNSEILSLQEATTWRNDISVFYSKARRAANEPRIINHVKFLQYFLFQGFDDSYVADPFGHVKHQVLLDYVPRLTMILEWFLLNPSSHGAFYEKTKK